MENKKAIIIGAGPAGLSAAYELLRQTDIIPIVVEMESQVGGISRTIDYKGNKIDMGGHRFFSKSGQVINWWLQFLPLDPSVKDGSVNITYHQKKTNFPVSQQTPTDPEKIMLVRPRKSRIYYNKTFFDYPLQLNFTTLKKLGFSKVVRIATTYFKARVFPQKPETNLEIFFKNRFGSELYHTFFEDYTEKVWGVPCSQIPADWGRQRIKDLNVTKVILHAFKSIFKRKSDIRQKNTSTSLIEQFLYPKYGPGQMWETVADEIVKLGGVIMLNSRVEDLKSVESSKIASCVVKNLQTGQTQELKAEHFFSTMPVRELIQQLQGIEIPTECRRIAEGLEYRDFLIVGVLSSNLPISKFSSEPLDDNWIYIQDKNVKAGRVQFFNNWSPHMVADPNNFWIGVEYFCSETDAFWNQSDQQIIKQTISEMSMIGLVDATSVLDTVVIRVKKAYPSYYGTYGDFEKLKNFLDSIPNLYEIGRNGMHKYNNSDHSMLTAFAVVNNIKTGKQDRQNVWDINTEDGYHEDVSEHEI